MTAQDHNRLLGIFHLIQGGLQGVSGLFVGIVYGIIGIVFAANARQPEEQVMATVFIILALIVAPIVLIIAGVNLTAGYKMLKEKEGARIWGIVASVLCVTGFPLGTALGVYGFWFLFSEEGKNFHLGLKNPNYLNEPSINNVNDFNHAKDFQNPPQPHSWK